MNNDIAIKVGNLTKIYHLYDKPQDRLKEALHPFRKLYHHDFYALNDVSFEIKKSMTVGIIGKNGAGKSTLLKMITGVLTPTSGSIEINGKIASLLELGAGFNPEMTGLENIYLNGTLMGFTKEEMDSKVDFILEFADIGEFIYQPVKMYSSGMFARLAFSVAINVDPDILIVDEALSVGDVRFQQKCIRKMESLAKNNKTILFVSHDLGMIKNFCNNVIWIEEGNVKEKGMPEVVIKHYVAEIEYNSTTNLVSSSTKKRIANNDIAWESLSGCDMFGNGQVEISNIAFLNSDKSKIDFLHGGEKVYIYMKLNILETVHYPIIGFVVKDRYGNEVTGLNSFNYELELEDLKAKDELIVVISFIFPKIKSGEYSISPAIAKGTQSNHIQLIWVNDAIVFRVHPDERFSKIGYYLILDEKEVDMRFVYE